MSKTLPTLDKLRQIIQDKSFLSGKELVELGLVDSTSTLSLWRLKSIGPPCIHLSSGKNLYPSEELLEWVQSCYLPRKDAPKISEEKSDKKPQQEEST